MEDLRINGSVLKERISPHYCEQFKVDWTNQVSRDTARNGKEGNKLRQYRPLKTEYKTETCVTCLMPRAHRSALSKFRCGVVPIRMKTGRYERLLLAERLCFHCKSFVEDEQHVLVACPLYNELQRNFYQTLQDNGVILQHKPAVEQLCNVLNISTSDDTLTRLSAKYCYDILTLRRKTFYK